MNYVSKIASAEAENTAFADLLHQFQVVEMQLAQLTQEIDQRLQREQELYSYIRLKTNNMLEVIGTLPLAAEELDNQSLLSFDPIGIVTDSFRQVLNNLKETNAELTVAKEEIQAIFNASGAGIMVVDATFHLRACNRLGKELFFPKTTDVVGKNVRDLIWTHQQSQSECILDRVLQGGDITEESDVAIEDRFYHVVATPINDSAGQIIYIILIYTDITQLKRQEAALKEAESRLRAILNGTPAAPTSSGYFTALFEDVTQRKKDEARIAHMAYFDALTNLPNRLLLKDRLNQMLTRAQRNKKQIALLFLDLDHFKRVNDTFGHDMGDQLLKIVANRLKNALRHCDSVCRLGGDEFVVLSDMISCQNDAVHIAEKIHKTLKNPLVLRNKEIFITTSIGIAMYPADGDDADTLIKNADAAVYQSKDSGRDEFRFYSSNANAQALQRLLLANDLRKALDQQEFYLVYQPQIDMHSGQTIGVEALLRWHHPVLGHLSPAQFIPVAEETGLILSIGRWVLATACRQIMEIQDLSGVRLRVAVNLSAKQFRDVGLVASIGELLADIGLDADLLELEITESTLMDNIDNATQTLYRLREMGLTLAIDDFGTGYSSLSYLHHFPIQRLKVDKTFVRRLSTHPEDSAITEAIIVMAHTMGIKVVAEGIDNKQELDFLTAKKCDEAQGFYFSRPLTIAQLTEKINAGVSAQSFCFFAAGSQ